MIKMAVMGQLVPFADQVLGIRQGDVRLGAVFGVFSLGGLVGTLAGLAGFAPPTMHAMGARLAGAFNRRLYNVAVTNVPGPQRPLYAAGAAMVSSSTG